MQIGFTVLGVRACMNSLYLFVNCLQRQSQGVLFRRLEFRVFGSLQDRDVRFGVRRLGLKFLEPVNLWQIPQHHLEVHG